MGDLVTDKRDLINKSNSKMVGAIAVSTFLAVFSLIASQALWSQRGYQARVIKDKEVAVNQLEKNQKAIEDLEIEYNAFVGAQDNIIGGNPDALGDRDGDNAKIVLDALPSKYDYPALVTSMEKILGDNGFNLKSISGDDDEIAQADIESDEPVIVPFEIESEVGDYPRVEALFRALYLSIRPIGYKEVTISGGSGSSLSVNIDGFTYYQPAKGLTIDTKEVK